jgi:hypothetical protein
MIDRLCRKSLVHCDVTSNFCGGKNSNYCFKWQRGNLLYKLVSSTNLESLEWFRHLVDYIQTVIWFQNYVTITCGSDVTGFDAVRVGRGMPRAPVPFCGCGGTPHGRGSFAERTVSGGRLSGRGKGVAKQTGVATRGLYLHYVQKGC